MNEKIPFLDLRVLNVEERKAILNAIEKVLDHGKIVLGPEVQEFEEYIANYCGKKYAVGVGSGSDALYLALKALDIKTGDEVITTSLSWIATANAISKTGATPVFADIGEDLNIDPEHVERLINKKTKAILAVHYTGRVCNMTNLCRIAKEHKIFLIEDAAQSFGAMFDNKKAGSFGDIACFSMNPMKILNGLGEAGIIITNDKSISEKLQILRYAGTINKEICVDISLNHRLDTLQAAILLTRIKWVDEIIRKRRENAKLYVQRLKDVVKVPEEKNHEFNVYYTFIILAEKRDELKEFLERKNIETKIQHPILMPNQPVYQRGQKNKVPNADKICKQILCLPANEKISLDQIEFVSEQIREFYGK